MPDRSPFTDATTAAGATFVDDAGWLMPAAYGDATAEYENTGARASVFDVSHNGKVEITGKEAPQFLHNLCTNEVVRLPVGSGCEAFLTNGNAKIAAYALIYRVRAADG